jgi:hypothetical protein
MRGKALLVGMVMVLAMAGPAVAKGVIGEANISGPGLGRGSGTAGGGGGMRIEAPAADRMWEGGIVDDRKEDSVSELGLSPADLGPRYLVTYRFDFGSGPEGEALRQELYPYAKGGPVTYTPPGQKFTGEENLTGMEAPSIPSGWFQATPDFFEYLVDRGLPATNPLAAAAKAAPRSEPGTDAAPASQPAPWAWVLISVAGLAALTLATPAVRRRVLLLVTRVNR